MYPKDKDGEPWVELPDAAAMADWDTDAQHRHTYKLRQTEKHRFFQMAFDYMDGCEVDGDYYEFGCHRVRTFRMALTEARRKNRQDMSFWAFDSFEGLPDPETDPGFAQWTQGQLSTSVDVFRNLVDDLGHYTDRVHTVPGFYDKSLTRDQSDRMWDAGSRAALITVDCDLYESAVPVFEFIERFLQDGTAIYIDDYISGYKGHPDAGVARAFNEFQQQSRFRFFEHLRIGWWGRSFIAYR